MIIKGVGLDSNSLIWRGVGLFLYGALIISTVDNVLKPKLIGEKAKVHPVLILIGVLGGLKAFGLIGIILGPLILALLVTFLQIFEIEHFTKKAEK